MKRKTVRRYVAAWVQEDGRVILSTRATSIREAAQAEADGRFSRDDRWRGVLVLKSDLPAAAVRAMERARKERK